MRGIYHVITIKNNPKSMSCRIGKASSLSHIFIKQDLGNRLSAEKNPNFNKDNIYFLYNTDIKRLDKYSRQRNESNQDLTELVKQRIDTLYDEAKQDYITFKRKERQEAKEHNSKPENKNNQKKLPRANFQIPKEKFVQELIITYGAEVDISKQDFKNVVDFYKKALDKLGIPKENVLFIAEHNDEKTPHYHIQFINYDFESHTSWNQKRNNMAIKESVKNNDLTSKGEPNILKYKAKQLRELQDDLATCFGTERGYKKEVKGRDYKTKQQWITGLEKEIESLEKAIGEKNVELQDAVDKFNEVAHEINNKLNDLAEDKKKKDAEILKLAEKIKKQNAELLQLQQMNEQLATNKANLELSIAELNELLADKQKKLHIIEENIGDGLKAERDIFQSIKEKEPLAKEVEELKKTELNLTQSIKDKTSKLASLSTDVEAKNQEYKESIERVGNVHKMIFKANQKLKDIETKLDNTKEFIVKEVDTEYINCINQKKPSYPIKTKIVEAANQKVKEIMPDF